MRRIRIPVSGSPDGNTFSMLRLRILSGTKTKAMAPSTASISDITDALDVYAYAAAASAQNPAASAYLFMVPRSDAHRAQKARAPTSARPSPPSTLPAPIAIAPIQPLASDREQRHITAKAAKTAPIRTPNTFIEPNDIENISSSPYIAAFSTMSSGFERSIRLNARFAYMSAAVQPIVTAMFAIASAAVLASAKLNSGITATMDALRIMNFGQTVSLSLKRSYIVPAAKNTQVAQSELQNPESNVPITVPANAKQCDLRLPPHEAATNDNPNGVIVPALPPQLKSSAAKKYAAFILKVFPAIYGIILPRARAIVSAIVK